MKIYKKRPTVVILILSCLAISSITAKAFFTTAAEYVMEAKILKAVRQKPVGTPDTLTKKELLNRIKKVVAKVLDVKTENIKIQSSFTNDLGADDLGLVELVMAFEDEFNITISDKDAEAITTVQKIYDYLIKKLKITK